MHDHSVARCENRLIPRFAIFALKVVREVLIAATEMMVVTRIGSTGCDEPAIGKRRLEHEGPIRCASEPALRGGLRVEALPKQKRDDRGDGDPETRHADLGIPEYDESEACRDQDENRQTIGKTHVVSTCTSPQGSAQEAHNSCRMTVRDR